MPRNIGAGIHPGLDNDPNWYRKAVFYEVLVRAFADSNGSGSGDFTGLIGKLDYIQSLGVDCLWLPPFYASPLRDGGYDIADYCAVLPEFGTMPDFQEFVAQAHARGLRVITDLVINHTSDAHPWFQSSRNDPEGPYGDFYVWSDTDELYQDARIIFVDTESSNWTFDPVRRQYFWHRFFSHQPDLNFENPAVGEAILDVVRFWMDMGIDGFRLDAVPYLFEEDGTNCENLPQTHSFLRKLRTTIDEEYPGRILLAEANQWPKDVVEYFGTEDEPECHMCFHFPVMPRIYYALRDEKAKPIVDILAETPDIPAHGQWGTFLRNHDELTLEMVTTEERAAMYAGTPRTRGCGPTSASGADSRPCSTVPARRSSWRTRWSCRCPAARRCTTATRSGWATTSGCPTATRCAPRCSGRRTATPASPLPIRASSTCPPCSRCSTTTRR